MKKTEYRAALEKIGCTIVGAAQYFSISRRQAQRLAAGAPIPGLIEKVLRLLVSGKINKEDLQ